MVEGTACVTACRECHVCDDGEVVVVFVRSRWCVATAHLCVGVAWTGGHGYDWVAGAAHRDAHKVWDRHVPERRRHRHRRDTLGRELAA